MVSIGLYTISYSRCFHWQMINADQIFRVYITLPLTSIPFLMYTGSHVANYAYDFVSGILTRSSASEPQNYMFAQMRYASSFLASHFRPSAPNHFPGLPTPHSAPPTDPHPPQSSPLHPQNHRHPLAHLQPASLGTRRRQDLDPQHRAHRHGGPEAAARSRGADGVSGGARRAEGHLHAEFRVRVPCRGMESGVARGMEDVAGEGCSRC